MSERGMQTAIKPYSSANEPLSFPVQVCSQRRKQGIWLAFGVNNRNKLSISFLVITLSAKQAPVK
jgi:hypothetical protein